DFERCGRIDILQRFLHPQGRRPQLFVAEGVVPEDIPPAVASSRAAPHDPAKDQHECTRRRSNSSHGCSSFSLLVTERFEVRSGGIGGGRSKIRARSTLGERARQRVSSKRADGASDSLWVTG